MAEIKTWSIEPYTPAQRVLWNDMAEAARNASFLFCRDYMDYHADRFADSSLIACHGGRPMALLPANRRGDELFSHQGLTYGGWLLPRHKTDGADMMGLFEAWLGWCRKAGIRHIHYKALPYIYASAPAQEDIYALWRYGARTECVLLSSAIDRERDPGFDYMRRRYLKRVAESGVRVGECDDLEEFWLILCDCLRERHDAVPVHSLDEILALKKRFQDRIRLFALTDDEGMQAGILVYSTSTVDHCQYIATTAKARRGRYLPYLVKHMQSALTARYLDFGTSNEQAGRTLNASLLDNKFGMGATGVAYVQYLLEIK